MKYFTLGGILIEAWNTVLFDKFCRFRHVLGQGLSDHSDELFRRRPYPPGSRVLDVGCGSGDCTQRIASQVGAAGSAVGVDCAPRFIDIGGRPARHALALPARGRHLGRLQHLDRERAQSLSESCDQPRKPAVALIVDSVGLLPTGSMAVRSRKHDVTNPLTAWFSGMCNAP
ncbi:MAG: hypothetical protein A3G81_17690 [Betaproteobacteria bacterium RIFCSPLOWO2_12_FULL_65_14]|nr:MAG: hypothetical protein A3G81_17690 [Betaproteobacteria bacterium RIFCSPLOWO2_12_FULL_65_14]